MVAGCIVKECALSVPAEQMWKLVVAGGGSDLPTLCAGLLAAAEMEGDGGPGTVKTLKFTPAFENAVMKSRVLELDNATYAIKSEILEGGSTREKLKSETLEIKLEAVGGGCVAKVKVEYDTLDEQPLSAEDEEKISGGLFTLFKKVESSILAK